MKKGTLTLAVILLLALAATYLVLRRPGETSGSGDPVQMLVEYDSSSIDRIAVKSRSGTLTLTREWDGWMVTGPVRYKADRNVVGQALGLGRKIGLGSLVSTNPQKQEIFQVDSTGTLVEMFRGDARVAAFRIGKMGATYTETYVRREGSDEVYSAVGLSGSPFTRQANEWRDKTIFSADVNTIADVRYRFGDTVFTLVRAGGSWTIEADTAKPDQVTAVLNGLANFQADGFVDSVAAEMPPASGEMEIAGTRLTFYPRNAGDPFYVRSSSSPQLFEVYAWRASSLLKRRNEFVPSPQEPDTPPRPRK